MRLPNFSLEQGLKDFSFQRKMESLNQTNKALIAFFSALVIGYLIVKNNYILVGILLFGFLCCFLLSWNQRFIIFSFTVFFPLCFSHLGPISEFKWIEILAPFLCILFIIEILYKKQPFFSKKSSLFFIAIAILSLWAIVNYIKSPVSAEKLFGASFTEGGLRSYYTIFIGIATFFFSFWFFKYKELNINKWFFLLLMFSLVLGYLRLIGFFNNFHVPFLGERFRHNATGSFSFYRIGGLSEVAILGITISLALLYKKRWKLIFIFIFIGFLMLLFFSGGRAAFFGTLLALALYVVLINRKYFFHLVFLLLILIAIYNIITLFVPLPNQLNRLFAIKGGFARQDLYRYHTFIYYWEIFKEYPIFGKGIGYLKYLAISGSPNAGFLSDQLMSGGHGSYLSILCTFGIGGIFFLTVILFGSIYYSYRIFKKDIGAQDNAKLALFAFLYLIILSIVFIPGGSGYNNMGLWFLSGMIAGINSKDEDKLYVKQQ